MNEELRVRLARWCISELGYSQDWPLELKPPAWAFDKADRILYLLSSRPVVDAEAARDLDALLSPTQEERCICDPNYSATDDECPVCHEAEAREEPGLRKVAQKAATLLMLAAYYASKDTDYLETIIDRPAPRDELREAEKKWELCEKCGRAFSKAGSIDTDQHADCEGKICDGKLIVVAALAHPAPDALREAASDVLKDFDDRCLDEKPMPGQKQGMENLRAALAAHEGEEKS